jgi:hypothetical protein
MDNPKYADVPSVVLNKQRPRQQKLLAVEAMKLVCGPVSRSWRKISLISTDL